MPQNDVSKEKEHDVLKVFSGPRILLPIIIGLGAVAWMFYEDFDVNSLSKLNFTYYSLLWLGASVVLMAMRDIGYIIRLRILTSSELNWQQCFRVVMLWEFTSAVTPSAIGGTSVAVFYLHKEKLSVGKSSAIVMATSFLDELYFIVTFPLLLMFFNVESLFTLMDAEGNREFASYFLTTAIVGYSVKLLFTLLVAYGLFVNPNGLKKFIKLVFKIKFLNRWEDGANKTGEELVLASRELRKQNLWFWIKAFIATIISWSSRYWVVNTMFLAFFVVDNHFLVFARQLVMWIMMLVSPTPGGSAFAEYVFQKYMGDFIPLAGLAGSFALLWRFITYYPYLVAGAIVFPRWVKKSFSKRRKVNAFKDSE